MLVIVQGKKFQLNDYTLPKDGYLDLILHSKLPTDKIDGYYVLDVDVNDFDEYYKFLQFRTDFQLREDLFDFMGHNNLLKYPHDFWRVKLIDDRIREFWYYSDKDKNIHKNMDMIEIIIPKDHIEDVSTFGTTKTITIPKIVKPSRVRDVLKHLPSRSLPKDHYIAGGAALYIAGITDKFRDIDIFTCNKNETLKYIEKMYGPNKYYGMYQSGNAITMKGSVDIQFITREYSSLSQIIHGFDVPSCSILFDGEKLWTTTKGLYCINNGVNWFEPDRSSPTYALRLSKYHMRGFTLRLPSIEDLRLNEDYINKASYNIMKKYYDVYSNTDYTLGVISNIKDKLYIDKQRIIDDYKRYLAISTDNTGNLINSGDKLSVLVEEAEKIIDPEYIINELQDPSNGDKTYTEIVRQAFINCDMCMFEDLINILDRDDEYEYYRYIEAYALAHISGDINANPVAHAMSYLNDNHIQFEWPNDPTSIMISTSVLNINPRLIGKNSQRHRQNISDYEEGTTNQIQSIDDIRWYDGNPMEQGLTGTFYPEPIMEDVVDFYLSSPLVSLSNDRNNRTLEPKLWYRKRE